MKKKKALFSRISIDLYEKVQKIKKDEKISQRKLLEKMINNYINKKGDK